jgi:hypothetical protein
LANDPTNLRLVQFYILKYDSGGHNKNIDRKIYIDSRLLNKNKNSRGCIDMAFTIQISDKIPGGEVYYLTPIMVSEARKLLKVGLISRKDDDLNNLVGSLIKEYLETGQLPNASIQAPVMNLSEDYIAGRDMIIRAGDYIALKQYQKSVAKESHR